uniref:Transmembrane protein 19 n=1 Tax=Callorhinchus milii TaxID=7868 RepID=A0A4W3JF90_CALMI
IMSNIIILIMTVAVSLSFWIISMTVSTYYGTLQPVSPGDGYFLIKVLIITLQFIFQNNTLRSWMRLALLGALDCCTVDTWASEIGSVFSSTKPRLITTWEKVPFGTDGGVRPVVLVASLFGGLTVELAYLLAQSAWFCFGFYLGATMQYSGYDENSGMVVNHITPNARHISGKPILDNNAINLFSLIIISLVLPGMSFWPRT